MDPNKVSKEITDSKNRAISGVSQLENYMRMEYTPTLWGYMRGILHNQNEGMTKQAFLLMDGRAKNGSDDIDSLKKSIHYYSLLSRYYKTETKSLLLEVKRGLNLATQKMMAERNKELCDKTIRALDDKIDALKKIGNVEQTDDELVGTMDPKVSELEDSTSGDLTLEDQILEF